VSLLVPDLSEWQGDVDWTPLVASYPAVIIRAYNGYRVDHEFVLNRDHAHAAGVRALGLYAYLVADRNELDQAAEFVHTVGSLRAGEWPIVDCETGAGDQSARVRAWAAHVARALGNEQPWLYSGEAFYREHGLGHAGIPADPHVARRVRRPRAGRRARAVAVHRPPHRARRHRAGRLQPVPRHR
jgi:GH25 family lysozyme M1 (1,4-beta-N-acetylmuramidase)